MKGLEYLAGVGIAAVILFAVIFITGLILLIVSVVKTVKGKQKIGGIIAGSIMCVSIGFFNPANEFFHFLIACAIM